MTPAATRLGIAEAQPATAERARELPAAMSLYLDLVRFLAALCVFVTHAKYHRFTDGWLDGAGRYGSDAVMIFFVLSGLVIAHVTQAKETDLRSYAIARLARLWSVALPALLMTFLADSIGRQLHPPVYDGPWYQGEWPALRLLVNAFFLGQLWFTNTLPFTNTPYWSLGYEFWYYALFGAAFFLRGPARWLTLAAFGAICGPKILLLMPIWLLGIAVHRLALRTQAPKALGWLLWLGSLAAYALYQKLGLAGYLLWRTSLWLGESFVQDQLLWSKDFVGNHVVGLMVAANFYGFWQIRDSFAPLLNKCGRAIRLLAGFTFSVYLFHMPMLHFFSALIRHDPHSIAGQAFVLVSTAATVLLLGLVSEHRKLTAKRWITLAFSRRIPRPASGLQ